MRMEFIFRSTFSSVNIEEKKKNICLERFYFDVVNVMPERLHFVEHHTFSYAAKLILSSHNHFIFFINVLLEKIE